MKKLKKSEELTMRVYFANCPRWWRFFFKRGFSHLAFTVSAENMGGLAVGMEMLQSSLILGLYKQAELSRKDCRIVEIKYTVPTRKRWFPYLSFRWGVFTCVSHVESVLSLHKASITPYRFYKKILRRKFRKKNNHIKSVKIIQTKGLK